MRLRKVGKGSYSTETVRKETEVKIRCRNSVHPKEQYRNSIPFRGNGSTCGMVFLFYV